jgi:serine/threonine protein kinase/tetratricopeptide (TPR) repeat protein
VGVQPDRAASIFDAAVELATAAERAAYLDAACGQDAQLRAEVDGLLRHDNVAGSFLNLSARPSPQATVDEPAVRERPGAVIGPYRLLEQIGEGGFGVVFMAEQQQPVRRKVALKVVKPGMDSRQVVARFEAERQALALMDHPNIAKVLDGGETVSGRPYFVMDLVKGLPVTDYCDQNQLSTRERLGLFVSVCQAVQHAHQKGVIHRDIKPSNVLVTVQDGVPLAKVIDFGIAKALGQPLTDKTLFTGFAQLVGTPLYMSPEQAALSNADVDTRSDVYSLGVLLYELLTGATPFDGERFRRVGYDEMRRIIREEEPPKPSTRISTLGQAATTISTQRKTDPRRLSRLFRGELDWVVMKALEKDRSRRYESASAFAADVQRYLHDQPVLACPPSAWYRFSKFARRHRAALGIGAVVVSAAILGVIGLAVNNALVTRQKEQKEAALGRAVQEKARADANLARARDAVREYLLKTSDSPLLKTADFHSLRKELLETAIPFYQEFARQAQDDPDLEVVRGRAYRDLGLLRRELGDPERGLTELAEAENIFRRLAGTFPDNPGHARDLAETLLNRGVLLAQLGRVEQAGGSFRQALDIAEPLASQHPTVPEYRAALAATASNLGELFWETGRYTKAETALRRAVALRRELVEEQPGLLQPREELAESWINLGVVQQARRQLVPAEEAFRKALEALDPDTLRKLPGGSPMPVKDEQTRAHAFNNLALMERQMGRFAAADQANGAALAIKERLADTFTSIPEYRQDLARAYNNRGILLADLGRRDEAQVAYEKAVQIYERLAANLPGTPSYAVELAGTYKNLGQLIGDGGHIEESLPWLTKAVDILERAYQQDGRLIKARESLCLAHWSRAMSLAGLRRFQPALRDWDRALELDGGRYQNALRLRRASNLLNLKDHKRATAEARAVGLSPKATADELYDAARVCAVSARLAAPEAPVAASYASRAVALLRQALGRGYKDPTRLMQDADLDALRAREDFRKLLNEAGSEPKR